MRLPDGKRSRQVAPSDRPAFELHGAASFAGAKEYNIQDYRSIYRHARVFGLIERRRENGRYMLDRILETLPKVPAHAVIQAIRAYSCLTDDNRWVEPPTHVEYVITTNRAPALESIAPEAKFIEIPNSQPGLDIDAND
jgi:hypothetical protein